MPWLVGTALIHSLAVTEKRGIFQSWTVLLAITAFSLSLLGTFLVRSGVLVSVHAFATDPSRGIYILGFFGVVVGGSLLLYAIRAPKFTAGVEPVSPLSREGLLLLNNLFLVVAAAAVLIGTLYPILADGLGLGRLSVGPPYFNKVLVPLILPLVVLIGVGAAMAWKRTRAELLIARLWGPAIIAIVAGVMLIGLTVGVDDLGAVAGGVLGFWAIVTALEELWRRIRGSRWMLSRQIVGMAMAHIGVGIFVIGVSLVGGYGGERDARMAPGETVQYAGHAFVFRGVDAVPGPNYQARRATFDIYDSDQRIATIHPAKRRYDQSGQQMTESGIDAGLFGDLYVSLGERLDNGTWSVRIYSRPFVRWIWAGGFFAAIGGLLALSDKRYWRRRGKRASPAVVSREPQPAPDQVSP